MCCIELLRSTKQETLVRHDYLIDLLKLVAKTEELLPVYQNVRKVYLDYLESLQQTFEAAIKLLEESRGGGGEGAKERDYRALQWKDFDAEERKVFAKYAETLKKTKKMLF